ncbi:LysM peptidoglycan-binding domain-containing protein [Leekyejoonella antrihumi]|uniref:LysM peptidoglycan-binding domain-containing protein n=1 Tax=Leekyejoonella antrihumi TaxID=1660198 RepID=A0A563DXQ1_9MICO|nr:LysM peptidoglycan-binding domain-containing protein [Leekyejoonella antrihumi]TWP34454.1 LysM peptidoglycan-binding domain-containing protein [Leekyejoonella antrihumi]
MMRRIGILVRGLLSLAVLVGIIAGAPLAVTRAGLLPRHVPGPAGMWADLATRDQSGGVLVGVLLLVGALAWAGFTVAVIRELAAAMRTRGARAADPMRGLEWSARPAAALVGAVMLMVLTTVGPTTTVSAAPLPAAAGQPTVATGAPATPGAAPRPATARGAESSSPAPQPTTASDRVYVVRRHDTLWRIAQTQLGDPMRYPQIVALNPQIGPSLEISPGQRLTLPATTSTSTSGPADTVVTVREGDCLSTLAAAQGATWQALWAANADRDEPGGQRLANPNLIRPGWTLTVPSGHTVTHPRTHASTHVAAHAQQPPTPEGSTVGTAPAPGSTRRAPGATPGDRPDLPNTGHGHVVPSPAPTPSVTNADPMARRPRALGDEQTAVAHAQQAVPWGQVALGGAGVLLVGGLLRLLRTRRRQQLRHRRPGRAIALPPPDLTPVESAITHAAALAPVDVDAIDHTLRDLAAHYGTTGATLPQVAAAQIDGTDLLLHLAQSADLPEPWATRADHRRVWARTLSSPDEQDVPVGQPAPWPLLVVIGTAEDESAWLLNLEHFGVLNLTGHREFGRDFLRHVTAGLACHPWSDQVQVDCVGVGEELAAISPRIQSHTAADGPRAAASALRAAHVIAARAEQEDTDAATGRAQQLGDEAWPARAVIADPTDAEAIGRLAAYLHEHRSRTGAGLLAVGTDQSGDADRAEGTTLTIDGRRQLSVPSVGLTVTAVGLSGDEARGCAALLACSDNPDDRPMTADQNASGGWRAFADDAGAIRAEHVLPRHDPHPDAANDAGETTSLLEADDQAYVQEAATTTEDLAVLAPRVTEPVSRAIQDSDPQLDAEVTAWFDPDSTIARVAVLGPVHATTFGPRCEATGRKPYFTELLAYLASRGARGATVEEVADAFRIRPDRVRKIINVLRTWLADDPRTGEPYLPDARRSPAAQQRGTGVYQVVGVLYDADLLRRLRLRGQARGADGIGDLATALRLVTGEPFTGIRKGGGAWIGAGDRIDQHLVCAIIDVAHVVATDALQAGDPHRARAAGEIAALAAPHTDIPYLDIASALEAGGNREQAMKLLTELCNRTEEIDAVPAPLSDRSETIMTNHKWLTDTREAS